jgi:hypothetical protein
MFSRWPACIQRPWLLTAFMPDALEGPRLILLGAPASGKGRQSELLVSSFELTHISTGAVLREVLTADRVHPLWLSYHCFWKGRPLGDGSRQGDLRCHSSLCHCPR